jgi:hypothetical protein
MTKPIPRTDNAPVVRTDFSDQAAWDAICAAIRRPVGLFRFQANVSCVDDPAFAGLEPAGLAGRVPPDYPHGIVFLVDSIAIAQPDHPVLVVDVLETPARVFRAIPRAVQSIENNLSIANMDFEEFAAAVDADGVFRGFARF